LKKFFAILFLSIHLFNIAGYSLFFQYFIAQSDRHIVQQLDKNKYADANLVQVKVPFSLPYSANWNKYERYDGTIEYNGTHYNYVKRKICNDTMYLLCLPNQVKTELYGAKNDYAKQLSDSQQDNKNSSEPAVKKAAFQTEYNYQNNQYSYTVNSILLRLPGIHFCTPFSNFSISPAAQPPDSAV